MTLLLVIFTSQTGAVHAQDPTTAQGSATGLRTQQDGDRRTAGLGFVVQQESWPFLWLYGGAEDAHDWAHYQALVGAPGIPLGQVKVPGVSATFAGETADWAHDALTYQYSSGQLILWASRLSPAVLVQSSANVLDLLAGPVAGNTYDGSEVSSRPEGPVFPKYVGYVSSGLMRVQALSSASLSLADLSQDWVLLWYGDNSHFIDTKTPLSYGAVPWSDAYQGDAPILVVFQNRPGSIKQASGGGVELSFAGGSGNTVVLPLYGRDILRAADTETWADGLPNAVRQRAQWWASRLCAYPATVSETYDYNAGTDTVTVTENVTSLPVCSGGTLFAPVPPMLGIVKDDLTLHFSAPVVDGALATEFGPSMGIENTQQYSWSVQGLRQYTNAQPLAAGDGEAPDDLKQELLAQVQAVIAGGHFAPWIFMDALPRHSARGDVYWLNPADALYQLSETAQVLTGTTRTALVNYLRSERTLYPPEDAYDLPLDEGTPRTTYAEYTDDWQYSWTESRPDVHLQAVPLYNYLALAEYYELTGDTVPSSVVQKGEAALWRALNEQDWATLYWFNGFDERRGASWNANRYFAGLSGLARLAESTGDTQTAGLARALLAKAAVLRLAMARYPQYLYAAGLVTLPGQPDWEPEYLAGDWIGYLHNYDWTEPQDDVRQVVGLDQFGVQLGDTSALVYSEDSSSIYSPYLVALRDMVPELASFLRQYARPEMDSYTSRVEALTPDWYVAYAEGIYGAEHNMNHPIDSYQTFLAEALIQRRSPDTLAGHLDIPWLPAADLFYIHKLAETIRAYQGDGAVYSLSCYLPLIIHH